jgi:hypothetical protein
MFPHLLYFWKKPLIIPKLALLSAANFYDPRINPLERSETDRALHSHKSAEKGRVLSDYIETPGKSEISCDPEAHSGEAQPRLVRVSSSEFQASHHFLISKNINHVKGDSLTS